VDWNVIVVIVIAALFILGHVLRRGEEAPPRNPRQRLQPGEPPRRTASDVDRFLQEMNRLRQRPSEPEYRPEPPPPPRPVLLVPPPERPRRPEPIRERPRVQPPPIILDVPPASAPVPPLRVVPLAPAKVSPVAAQLRELLRSPQSLRAAILLQEVLGPPRCRRK
jgi:hypothetical protein